MRPISISLASFQSFDEEGARIDGIERVNIFLGPNNVGKSKILRAFQRATQASEYWIDQSAQSYRVGVTQKIGGDVVERVYAKNASGGGIPGHNHWEAVGRYISNAVARVELAPKKHRSLLDVSCEWEGPTYSGYDAEEDFRDRMRVDYITRSGFPYSATFLVQAERDVDREGVADKTPIQPNGGQVTSHIARSFADAGEDRAVLDEVLRDLNFLCYPDYEFEEVSARLDRATGQWEIYLKSKVGFIPLSQCGSGLKCLIHIVVLFVYEVRDKSCLLALEEIENSLHPHTQRRLLSYIDHRLSEDSCLLVSTHSPVALDFFQGRDGVSFYEVFKEPESVRVRQVSAFNDRVGVLDALGVRASDAMQTNFVIWVEGPSDRIFLRNWISIVSSDTLREHEHYVIMFYGGKLLSHLTLDEGDEVSEFISLLRINKNCAILIDSDRRKKGGRIAGTKRRIYSESEKHARFRWTTQGREIENYVSPDFWVRNFNVNRSDFDDYDQVFPVIQGKRTSDNKPIRTKVDLAAFVEQHAGEDDFCLNWRSQTRHMIELVRAANGLDRE